MNENSANELGFFGVKLELWQIDTSRPAVRFSVLSRPATPTRRAAKASALEDLSETRQLQLEWWTEVEKRLRESKQLPSTQTPRPQYWYNIALGRSGIHLSCTADTWENRIGIRVYIRGSIADQALEQLSKDREEIEREIGLPLEWNPHPEKTDKIILLSRSADLEIKEQWEEYLNWMIKYTLAMRKAFAPRVKKLTLGERLDRQQAIDSIAP